MRISSDHWAVNFSACPSQPNENSVGTRQADEQEAEAGVCKQLCSFVDDGLESEPLEEYGKRWTSHTAAYDDDFGHIRVFQVTRVRTSPKLGKGEAVLEGLFLGGRWKVS